MVAMICRNCMLVLSEPHMIRIVLPVSEPA